MFSKTLSRSLQQVFNAIKEAHGANKPNVLAGFKSGDRWRHKSMEKTLNFLADPKQSMTLEQQAQLNLNQWARTKASSPQVVEVTKKDWGLAALEVTKKYGKPYSILNMANPIYPGGAFMQGGRAQEENMWHRTTCAQSLADSTVYLDQATQTFRYHETATKLLEGKLKMTDAEFEALKKSFEATDSEGYKVFFSRDARICFRGPDEPLITGFDDFGSNSHISDSGRSFKFLLPEDIFPFYELRSAAPDLTVEPQALNSKALEQYKADLRRRVAAQLDTLILEKQPNVVLGAWGCGAFKNNPHIVAKIYGEEIVKRAQFFEHILFPIINTGSKDNHAAFADVLSGIKLGNTNTPSRVLDHK